ncbi:hypothetical protein [Lentimicrobium sp. S6]|uniref:hypothetical protein n=1 Tax=Lentimicrobium sp. S6 TaxID=2735872 RepID=UPI001553855C|nr:hypothetical protein [Lentimicrobium sp. S6]NPD48074.1 hypothetical protein [Lentimicrobium sp. S6]
MENQDKIILDKLKTGQPLVFTNHKLLGKERTLKVFYYPQEMVKEATRYFVKFKGEIVFVADNYKLLKMGLTPFIDRYKLELQ